VKRIHISAWLWAVTSGVLQVLVYPKPNLYIPPPGCAEAYAKYLQLAPNGPHAAEIKGIMTSFYVK